TLGADIAALASIGDAIKEDAYTIQGRSDPRRRWATTPVPDRPARLEAAKTLSTTRLLPVPAESERLHGAANAGSGLNLTAARQGPPYTPAVVN
ncbi:hypothetical protein, partial [Klebsiella pneumoniae]|uniref:hypothetical protein n=1 Tax=Klebsiella pneumoniae TaxID=573 RepID=UPI00210E282A